MMLELACFNLEDALLAQDAGADRIELCEDYAVGGLTPARAIIEEARIKIRIPLFVMIRPIAPNFVYTPDEVAEMKMQIAFCKQTKCDGVVFGILNAENEIDAGRCKELVELAKPMHCTFHRAFDETPDLTRSLQSLIYCGFSRVLTSGGKGRAKDNLNSLAQLIKMGGNKIVVMPGGGVRAENITQIISNTGCKEIHTAAVNPHSERLVVSEVKQIKKLIVE